MQPFSENARVCLIGDSITQQSWWSAFVADYYHTHLPQQHVQFFNCGISGATALANLIYLRDNVLSFGATHAVIMLGTNDINAGLYGPDVAITDTLLAQREEALCRFEERLWALAEALYDFGRIRNLIFMTPIPYDERGADADPGRDASTKRCGDIVKRVAAQYHAPVIDLYAKMRPLLDAVNESGCPVPLLQSDHTHPTKEGYAALARIILREWGFDVAAPTAETMADRSVLLPLSEAGQRYYEAALHYTELFTYEWLYTRYADDQRFESRKRYVDSGDRTRMPAWYGDTLTDTCINFLRPNLTRREELEQALREAAAALAE